jgi:hypothetical protein
LQLLKNSKIQRLCETREKVIDALEESLIFSVSEGDVVTADLDLTFHENMNGDEEDTLTGLSDDETSDTPSNLVASEFPANQIAGDQESTAEWKSKDLWW